MSYNGENTTRNFITFKKANGLVDQFKILRNSLSINRNRTSDQSLRVTSLPKQIKLSLGKILIKIKRNHIDRISIIEKNLKIK